MKYLDKSGRFIYGKVDTLVLSFDNRKHWPSLVDFAQRTDDKELKEAIIERIRVIRDWRNQVSEEVDENYGAGWGPE